MTADEAVAALDAIPARDPEVDHDAADKILLAVVPPEVAEAYSRLVERSGYWATS